ncbi:MAG: hypothetical protein ACK5KL_08900 [Dysgonomonas sp.]
MKEEKREVIIMTDNGTVIVPGETKMSIAEIADLFGIYYRTAKRHIRTIEKSGIAGGDYTMICTVDGQKIYPEYYGLEMIIALAFRIQSRNVEMFRKWLVKRMLKSDIMTRLVLPLQNVLLN